MRKLTLIFILFTIPLIGFSQADSLAIEKVRTESGVDPTRVNSKLAYSIWYFDKSDNRSITFNRLKFTAGIQRMSLSLKYEIGTQNSGVAGEGFETKGADLEFAVTNTLYVKNKHAVAVGLQFSLPTGAIGFGSQYFSMNPSFTYAYTINPSLILAIQPQYTFHITKDTAFPDLSVFTLRTFLAKFEKTGWFYVFEPRIIHDFTHDNFNLVLSPIIGKAIGGGFNLGIVLEFPIKQEMIDNRGILIQTGITKNF